MEQHSCMANTSRQLGYLQWANLTGVHTVYHESFEAETFRGFCGFCMFAKLFYMKI